MKIKKMNIRDLKINKSTISTSDLQKLKGGLGDPPPIGSVPPDINL